jgi:hypothetical protein
LEGVEAFSSLDIYKEVGANVALTKIANTNVKDGFLTIEFRAIVENVSSSLLSNEYFMVSVTNGIFLFYRAAQGEIQNASEWEGDRC